MLSKKALKILEKVYNTPNQGASFSSAAKLKKQLLDEFKIVTKLKDIEEWLNNNLTYTLHRRAQFKFKRNPTVVTYIDEQWQIDLLFLPDIKNTYVGVLLCIDVASRFVWGEPIKNKTGKEITNAMKIILDRAFPRKPLKIQGDKGSEFYNKSFLNLLKDYGIIEFFSTYSDHKAAIVERVIRTIKEKLYRILDTNPSLQNEWQDLIPSIIKSYNNTHHSGVDMRPKEVTTQNIGKVLWNLYGQYWDKDRKQKTPKFNVGDFVRISSQRHPYHKGYKGKWKEEIFKISKIKYSLPHNVYILKEWDDSPIKGVFYPYELNKVYGAADQQFRIEEILKERKKRNGKKEFYIKWSGWSEKYNSWVPEENLEDLPYLSYTSATDQK